MKLFGTAGIRGGRLWEKVTPELALNLGMAIATYKCGKAVVARDGRTSSVMLKNAMISGLLASGMEVLDADLIPTPPALAWATREYGDAGVMITASHNPPTDNGIKVFNGDGTEFYVEQERELEALYSSGGTSGKRAGTR